MNPDRPSVENSLQHSQALDEVETISTVGSKDRTQNVYDHLLSIWKFQSFLPGQEAAVNAALDGSHVMYRAPTAGGKSLSSQLAAFMKSGVTIFVEPYLPLIRDQVDSLGKILASIGWEDRVMMITSESYQTNPQSIGRLKRMVDDVKAKQRIHPVLCYVTPERACLDEFSRLLEELHNVGCLSRIVFDEAHCIYENAEFRHSFAALNTVTRKLPNTSLTFASATFSMNLREDLKREFLSDRLPRATRSNQQDTDCVWIADTQLFRPNLRCKVFFKGASTKSSFMRSLATDCWERYRQKRGIVFCLTPRDTETMAENFNQSSVHAAAAHYHSGMGPKQQEQFWEDWASGAIRVVCATPGLIHGINPPDIHYVIFAALPKTIEEWTQGIGRAGRDGREAECMLYYSADDIVRNVAIMFRTALSAHEEKELRKPYASPDHPSMKKLAAMASFALDTSTCRHAYVRLLDAAESATCPSPNTLLSPCGSCDSCESSTSEQERRDLTPECWQITKILQRANMAHQALTLRQLEQAVGGKSLATRRFSLKNLCLESEVEHTVSTSLYELAILRLFSENFLSFKIELQSTNPTHSYVFVVITELGLELAARPYTDIQSGHSDQRLIIAIGPVLATYSDQSNTSPQLRLSEHQLPLASNGQIDGRTPKARRTRSGLAQQGVPSGLEHAEARARTQCPFCNRLVARIDCLCRHWGTNICSIRDTDKQAVLRYKDSGRSWQDTLKYARQLFETGHIPNAARPRSEKSQVDCQTTDTAKMNIASGISDTPTTLPMHPEEDLNEDRRMHSRRAPRCEIAVACPFCSGHNSRTSSLGIHWKIYCQGNKEDIRTTLDIAANHTGRNPSKWNHAYQQACALAEKRSQDDNTASVALHSNQRDNSSEGADANEEPINESDEGESPAPNHDDEICAPSGPDLDGSNDATPLRSKRGSGFPSMALSPSASERPTTCPFCTGCNFMRTISLHPHWTVTCKGNREDVRRALEFYASVKNTKGNWARVIEFAEKIAADRVRQHSGTIAAPMTRHVATESSEETYVEADTDDEWSGVDDEPVPVPTSRPTKNSSTSKVSVFMHVEVTTRATQVVRQQPIKCPLCGIAVENIAGALDTHWRSDEGCAGQPEDKRQALQLRRDTDGDDRLWHKTIAFAQRLAQLGEPAQLSTSPNRKRTASSAWDSDEEEQEATVGTRGDDDAYEPGPAGDDHLQPLRNRRRIAEGKLRSNPVRGARPGRRQLVESGPRRKGR